MTSHPSGLASQVLTRAAAADPAILGGLSTSAMQGAIAAQQQQFQSLQQAQQLGTVAGSGMHTSHFNSVVSGNSSINSGGGGAVAVEKRVPRVTAMTWINEHDSCHLVTGE